MRPLAMSRVVVGTKISVGAVAGGDQGQNLLDAARRGTPW